MKRLMMLVLTLSIASGALIQQVNAKESSKSYLPALQPKTDNSSSSAPLKASIEESSTLPNNLSSKRLTLSAPQYDRQQSPATSSMPILRADAAVEQVNHEGGGVSSPLANSSHVNSGSWNVNSGSWGVSEGSYGVKSGSWNVSEGSWGVKSGPWNVSEGSWGVKSGPWNVSEGPWGVKSGPWNVSEGSWGVKSGPWNVSEGSWGAKAGSWHVN